MSVDYGTDLGERINAPVTQWTRAFDSLARSFRVAMPCVVVSFDPVKQTVAVVPAMTEVARIAGQLETRAFKEWQDVPIVLPRGGGFTFTVPVKPGDECLVVFADVCIDSWWQSGAPLQNGEVQQQNQFSQRRHSLADGFAILGPWNQTRVLSDYSTTSAQLRSDSGTCVIDIAANAVTVTAPTVNVSGASAVNITGGNCHIDGKNFLAHEHTGVQSGGGTSGPVL